MRATIAVLTLTAACRDPAIVDCQCGLVCSDAGVGDGNADISGTAVDAYFAGVVEHTRAAARIDAEIDAELQAIARSLALDPSATAAEIRAAAASKLAGATGSLHVQVGEPRCAVSTDAALIAASRCAPEFSVMCDGTCSPIARSCAPDKTMRCSGAQLACDGECAGDCVLAVAAACAGTCRGECDGACSVRDATGACDGRCDGDCHGTCNQVGGKCDGTCEGICTSAAPPSGCATTSQTSCTADKPIACAGQCDGTLQLAPMSTCVVAAQAEVDLGLRCDPPDLTTTWQWREPLLDDAAGQAAFKAWLAEFTGHVARLTAARRKAQLVRRVGSDLRAALDLVKRDAETQLEGDNSLQRAVGLACALSELDAVGTTLDDGAAKLQAALTDAVQVSSALAG